MDDRTQLDQPGDEEEIDKTEAMNKPSRKKASAAPSDAGSADAEAGGEAQKSDKKKGRDDWQTVQSPKAQRPAASTPAPAAPPSGSAAAPAARPAAPAPAGPVSGASAMPSAQGPQSPALPPAAAGSVPMAAQLSRMGINNPTAQWASLGVGAFLVLCCACSCVGLAIWAISGGLSSF